ncbi:MAG: hypothetical protein NW224_06605 [Leptolyngbyaceae cyanobacterium bins.302]|nr:hypothetical protein [Leptolyngbyaceae cyanobacterium bins.302]
MFFNSQQGKFASEVMRSVEKYGSPKIVCVGDQLRICVKNLEGVQSLFGFDSDRSNADLVGVILYTRELVEQITILHIAIREEYSTSGVYANRLLAMSLIQKVREAASQIKGVRLIALMYGESPLRKIPVHHALKQPILS